LISLRPARLFPMPQRPFRGFSGRSHPRSVLVPVFEIVADRPVPTRQPDNGSPAASCCQALSKLFEFVIAPVGDHPHETSWQASAHKLVAVRVQIVAISIASQANRPENVGRQWAIFKYPASGLTLGRRHALARQVHQSRCHRGGGKRSVVLLMNGFGWCPTSARDIVSVSAISMIQTLFVSIAPSCLLKVRTGGR